MEANMKMRAKLKDDVTEVKMIISHPMETGRKKDDFGVLIPAHFVQWGTGISKNPYLTFYLKGAKVGDKIVVNWQDNLGQTGTGEILVAA
jgi:sulfur-oxidizing protein SoxZ